jgi:hypothetical protein
VKKSLEIRLFCFLFDDYSKHWHYSIGNGEQTVNYVAGNGNGRRQTGQLVSRSTFRLEICSVQGLVIVFGDTFHGGDF